jgi:hypothetical protein
MAPVTPQFPSLDVWEGMSEPEQDALISRLERARRRKLLWSRIQAGAMWAAAAVCLSGLVYLAVIGT